MSLVLKHLRQQIMEMGDTMFGNATTATVGHDAPLTTIATRFQPFLYAFAGEAITLRPRKVGVAQLMVYYNVNLPDGTHRDTTQSAIFARRLTLHW